MSAGFDANALERRYAFLDDCPEHLLEAVVTLPFGTPQERVRGVLEWRDALLRGSLPPSSTWPSDAVAAPVRAALEQLGLLRFLKDQEGLVDELLVEILAAFSRHQEALGAAVAAKLRELEELELARLRALELARLDGAPSRKRRRKKGKSRWSGGRDGPAGSDAEQDFALADAPSDPVAIASDTQARLQQQAEREIVALVRAADADADLLSSWEERARLWAELSEVFGDLGNLLGRGFDLSLGVLRHTGWLKVLELRKLVERLPQLREVVQTLGRLQHSEHNESVTEQVFRPVMRLADELREVTTPLVPAETRGVERSGSIARMLPAEAALLGHPTLKTLWHARRAERALLSYRVEGVETERVTVEREGREVEERHIPRPERGPIIAVIDTSGSMNGMPELVAKAIVLEALRTALLERRRCFVFAFSGPGQVLEHELSLNDEGLGRLLAFLGFSFGGGTDIGAVDAAVSRLKLEGWEKADLVIVTDGEWRASASLVGTVREACQAGTRVHGIQIGRAGRTGLHDLADPVHVFQEWAALGGW